MNIRNQKGITTFWGISILLMESVVVLFVFYILYFFWIENPTPTSNIYIIRTFNKEKVVSIPSTTNTTDWLAYGSTQNQFTLQYPGGFTVDEDEIVYGSSSGTVLELGSDTLIVFSLRVFPLLEEEKEKGTIIADVFTRIIGIDPSIYQSYPETVATIDATVYRQVPGSNNEDFIYFMSEGSFFEVNFNQATANILSTFIFME